MPTDTIQQLAAITDAAQFERISTSVLRSANPSVYANLSHQGVNTDGKTIKAPLDNVGWIMLEGKSMIVAAAHTTASRDDLNGKWLHDPATVKPRKKDGKPTQPAGDLIKAISEIEKLRATHTGLQAILALTCNREEPTDVRVKAQALAHAADIRLDFWSVSRIAQHLDTTADGQAIRHAYLGTPAVLLSKNELLRAGLLSLDARMRPTEPESMIDRAVVIGGVGHALLSGASGMGKTTLCVELLRTALSNGQAGLVLSDQTVRDATSIEEAIDIELRRYLPYLEPLAGVKALELCSEPKPLVLVVEDISRAENTVGLLNKVVAWALQGISTKPSGTRRNWRLLCPVWPRYLAAIERSKDVYAAGIVQTIGLYSEKEALVAVKRRAVALGRPQNDLAAGAIARALGRDPLLIGLHEFTGTGRAQDAISEYVAREFDSVALTASLTATDIEGTVKRFTFQMMQHRRLAPTWTEAIAWLGQDDDRKAMRALVDKGGVLRLVRVNGEEIIEPRHDRVLHALIASSIAARIASDCSETFLSDPYFAEYVGTAAVQAKLPAHGLKHLIQNSPLVAFFALKDAVSRESDYAEIAANSIEDWITSTSTQSAAFSSRRFRALRILAEIDSPIVLRLTTMFPSEDHRQPLFEARFRNGDIVAALNWLTEYPFEADVGRRHELVDYVRSRSGDWLIESVEKVLESKDPQPHVMLGALYLAGYLGDPRLARSIRSAWNAMAQEERDLEAFLWAAAQVCGNEAASTLGPVCDAWAALPEDDDPQVEIQTRSSVAAYGLAWKFRDHPPLSALPYFVERAASEALRWPITYMMRGIDHPIALQHHAEYIAELNREGKDGFASRYVRGEWQRQCEDLGHSMSAESKRHLVELAADLGNDVYLRKEAFALWEISIDPDDLQIAQAILPGDVRHDTAVWARARRQDQSVITELIEKIMQNPWYWWQAGRYIWTDALTALLDESIQKLGNSLDQQEEGGAWSFPEHLLRLEVSVAEQVLAKHWEKLQMFPRFVQVALFLATPKLVRLANAAIQRAKDKKKMFEHFSFTVGLRTVGRAGLTREAQLEALRPYFGLLSDHDLLALWETCNRRNWKSYRREHLDEVIIGSGSTLTSRLRVRPPFDMSDLDKELNGERSFSYLWLELRQGDGGERDELLAALLDWVRKRGSVAALGIAADIYSHEANRAEFLAFEQASSQLPGSAHVVERVRFDIFNRTLI